MSEKIFAGCVFDPEQAEKMIGKTVLVSLTCMNDFGDLDAFEQFSGPILRINNDDGLVVQRKDTDEEFSLPPDLDHYQAAKPGDYKLAESDVIVTNPDFVVEWDIYPPDKS
ncbi:MAG: hypothetical protein OQK46_05105 [Gammaproteobacteria bacterium]|nr:hypothetical protein [Gammaproteobacteria bacterium]